MLNENTIAALTSFPAFSEYECERDGDKNK